MKLKITRVSKSYGRTPILQDLSLEMKEGHILVVVGPSGAGKTTLLRLIAGLDVPDAGSIMLNGNEIPKTAPGLLCHRRSIGMLFQAYNLFPHLSALENVMLPLTVVHGCTEEEAREKSLAALDRFSLKQYADRRPSALSGGQKQRVALVRSIVIEPALFLFDEPTSALDPEMTSEVLDAIGELKKDQRDFILVTHHLGFAHRIADMIAFLNHGQIVEAAAVNAFFGAPKTDEVKNFLAKVLKY